jgi:(4-O-methyl)-D-glucuronate---lignin esterase
MLRPALLVSSFVLLTACGPIGSEGKANTPGQMPPNSPEQPSVQGPGGDMQVPGQIAPGPGTLQPPGVEGSGAACALPMLLDYPALAAIDSLPDPFTKLDGTRISSKGEWACRRAEIASQVQQYSLGPKPPRPESVSGVFTPQKQTTVTNPQTGATSAVVNDTITVSVSEAGQSIEFDAAITYPASGTGPFPAMIGVGGSSLDNAAIAALGVALINFPNGDVAAQQNGSSRGQGKFYTLYGANHPAGAMIAWAWGVSRLIDALEQTPEANIDTSKLGATGCSRNGKGALVVGAFEERIALTVSQESGAGGSSTWRLADLSHQAWIDAGRPQDQDVQTLRQIVDENVWFTNTFRQFSETATKLPFDQHMVMGLVAPRALFVVNNTDPFWLGKESSYVGAVAANSVWQALGTPDKMGSSQVGGHAHCSNVPVQTEEVGRYIRKFMLGEANVDSNVLYTDGGYTMDRARWTPWETPALAD